MRSNFFAGLQHFEQLDDAPTLGPPPKPLRVLEMVFRDDNCRI